VRRSFACPHIEDLALPKSLKATVINTRQGCHPVPVKIKLTGGSLGGSQRIGTGGTPPAILIVPLTRWRCRDFAIFSAGAKMKAILRWTIATYLFCASTLAFAGNLPGGTGTSFWVGYNEAWFADHYLNWLASNPVFGLSSGFEMGPLQRQLASWTSGLTEWRRVERRL
jgi:hypothetical protein